MPSPFAGLSVAKASEWTGHGAAVGLDYILEKYQQLSNRHAPSFIRHILALLRRRSLTAAQAAEHLGLSSSRLYALFASYLRSCSDKKQGSWIPGTSGGDHASAWPKPVIDLLKKRLACSPPCPYSFAASEAFRLLAFKLDRAQVRRWALAHGHAHPTPPKRPRAPVRRWQRSQIGELWQLDASPHRWFPPGPHDFPMLNMLDDCSRVFVGSKLYGRELLLSYLDFLPTAFLSYGRPLQIYVDYHAIFFAQNPDALTQLGWALKFYDISFLYAPTPQAKGKVEREHQFWQGRLPPYFASEQITDIETANPHIDALRLHRNLHETHRELRMTPQHAWERATQEKRTVLRPAPRCPWWHYVWSLRTTLKVGPDGRVPIGTQRLRVERPPGTRIVLCLHPTGHHSVLATPPDKNAKPVLLFTNRPK
jgi:hypothetical protein